MSNLGAGHPEATASVLDAGPEAGTPTRRWWHRLETGSRIGSCVAHPEVVAPGPLRHQEHRASRTPDPPSEHPSGEPVDCARGLPARCPSARCGLAGPTMTCGSRGVKRFLAIPRVVPGPFPFSPGSPRLCTRSCTRHPQAEARWGGSPGSTWASRRRGEVRQNQLPRDSSTARSTAGRSVMIPSTPMPRRSSISAGSSTVHTCTWRPRSWALSTNRSSTRVTPL